MALSLPARQTFRPKLTLHQGGMLESEIFENYKYKDALDSASSFNTKLLVERQSRLPFLDTQTNIAQVCVVSFYDLLLLQT